MVNYESENLITAPAHDICRVQILERRAYVIDAIEVYRKELFQGRRSDTYAIKSRIEALILEIKPQLQSLQRGAQLKEIEELLATNNFEKLREAFDMINQLLYKKHLIKWDSKQDYDTTNVELENRAKGL